MSSYLAVYFYACEVEIRLKFTDKMKGYLHTSSGIERFVLLICFFVCSISVQQQTSPPLLGVKEATTKPDDGHQK